MSNDFNIEHTVCKCGRWWTSMEYALLDGYQCIDAICTCDYCRDIEEESDDEEMV